MPAASRVPCGVPFPRGYIGRLIAHSSAHRIMTFHVLNGAFERIARAAEHLADLRPRIEALREFHKNAFTVEFDSRPPYPIRVWPVRIAVSIRIPVLIGEICYNLRSALDYLVFELAKLDSGVSQDGTQFPIEDAPKGFAHRIKTGRLKGINPAHVAIIEGLQPYKGCEWTKALREVSNPDKHRELAVIKGDVVGMLYTPRDPEFPTLDLPIRSARHPLVGKVDMKFDHAVTVQFREGMPVMETLEEIKLQVADTLTAFKPEFDGQRGAHSAPALRRPVGGSSPPDGVQSSP